MDVTWPRKHLLSAINYNLFMNRKQLLTGFLVFSMVMGTAATAYAHDHIDGKRAEHKSAYIQNLTDDQKAAMKQAHELAKSGDKEGAKQILEAAGLDADKMKRMHRKKMMRRNPEVRQAVAGNDYAAFQAATEGKKISEFITADRFAVLVQAYEARQNDDHETARALMKDLHEQIKADRQSQNS